MANLILTTAGASVLTALTAAGRAWVFTQIEVGSGRNATPESATALTTPYSPVRRFNVGIQEKLADQISFVFVDPENVSTAYSPTEMRLFVQDVNGAEAMCGYVSAAVGDTLYTRPAGVDEYYIEVSLALGSINASTVTVQATPLAPASESVTGTVRLVSDGQAVAREVTRLASRNWRALTRVGNALYASDTQDNFARLNPTTGEVTPLASLPSGHSNLNGITWEGADVNRATHILGIAQTPPNEVLLRYTIATDTWETVGTGQGFDNIVVALANYGGREYSFDNQTPSVAREFNPSTGRGIRGSFFAMPATVTGTLQSAEFVGDVLYVWTTDGQWTCRNIAAHLADSSVALVFTNQAGSDTRVVGSAVRDTDTAWVLLRASTYLSLGILDLGSGRVSTGDGFVFGAEDIDARLGTFGFLTRAPAESYTSAAVGAGLSGDGTTASPLAIDEASQAEYATGALRDKVVTPYSTRAAGLTEETSGDDGSDALTFFDASVGNRRKRITIRNFIRNLAPRATTSNYGTAKRSGARLAQGGTDTQTYLSPADGTTLVKNFDAGTELPAVTPSASDSVVVADASGGGLLKRVTMAALGSLISRASRNIVRFEAPNKNVTSATWTDFAVLPAITPSDQTSFILVDYTALYNGVRNIDIRLLRNTEAIREIDAWDVLQGADNPIYINRIDQPRTTAPVVYKVQIRRVGNAPAVRPQVRDQYIYAYELR